MFALWENSHGPWFSRLESRGIRCERSVLSIAPRDERLAFAYFKGAEAKACVLLLHGTGNDALFGWDLWIEELSGAGFAVLAVDLEGHGKHSTTRLDPQTFTYTSDALVSWLSRHGWDRHRLIVCGYSLGALFALKALSSGRIKAARLVLLALPTEIKLTWSFIWQELLSIFRLVFWRHLFERGWRMTLPALGWWRRRTFPLRLENFQAKTYPDRIASLFQRSSPLSLLSTLKVPCLLIHGERDALAPSFEALYPQESFVVSGANHFLLSWHREGVEHVLRWLEDAERRALTEP